jgi:hypothetical protein
LNNGHYPNRSVNQSNLRSVSQNTTIIKTTKSRDLLPVNMFNPDKGYFRQIDQECPLFDVKVLQEDFDHLMTDDLDPISKNEVVYKIMKSQLRDQQKKLILMKEQKRVSK